MPLSANCCPQNAVLSIAGNYDWNSVIALAETLLAVLILLLVSGIVASGGHSSADYAAFERARAAVEQSDLVLFVVDASRPITDEDIDIYNQIESRPHIVVYNKNDLIQQNFQQQIPADVEISAAKSEGIDELRQMIKQKLGINLTTTDQYQTKKLYHKS